MNAPLNAFPFDSFQQAAADAYAGGTQSVGIRARAGTGKSSFIARLIHALSPAQIANLLFTSFTNSAIDDMATKTVGVLTNKRELRTCHSLAYGPLRAYVKPFTQNWVNEWKYSRIAQEAIERKAPELNYKEKQALQDGLVQLWNLARQTLTPIHDTPALEALIQSHVYDLPVTVGEAQDWLVILRDEGLRTRRNQIDNTDMLWMVEHFDLQCAPKSHIIIDEAQDLNAAQHALVQRHANDNTVWLVVGDEEQAIFDFAGARPDGLRQLMIDVGIKKALKMPTCWRCPASVVAKAQEYVPDIMPRPDAPEGEIITLTSDDFYKRAKTAAATPGDMLIISRQTAPLVPICFSLIEDGVPAYIPGKGIGKQLEKTIDAVTMNKEVPFADFPKACDTWRWQQVAIMESIGNDRAIEQMHNRVDTVIALYKGVRQAGYSSLDALKIHCGLMFAENKRGMALRTIHSAKGLQAKTVVIVAPEDMPSPKAVTEAAIASERRVAYVGVTRAQETLAYLPKSALRQ